MTDFSSPPVRIVLVAKDHIFYINTNDLYDSKLRERNKFGRNVINCIENMILQDLVRIRNEALHFRYNKL